MNVEKSPLLHESAACDTFPMRLVKPLAVKKPKIVPMIPEATVKRIRLPPIKAANSLSDPEGVVEIDRITIPKISPEALVKGTAIIESLSEVDKIRSGFFSPMSAAESA